VRWVDGLTSERLPRSSSGRTHAQGGAPEEEVASGPIECEYTSCQYLLAEYRRFVALYVMSRALEIAGSKPTGQLLTLELLLADLTQLVARDVTVWSFVVFDLFGALKSLNA
jgi:hypothetical protein